MTTEEQKDYKLMKLDDVIKANEKEGRGRPLSGRRRRRPYNIRRNRNSNSKPRKDNRRRILVENLNKDMQNPELQKLFEKYGKLVRCGVKFDKLGSSRGLADVEFSTHEECEKAIHELDNAVINENTIRVKYAASQAPKFVRRVRTAGEQRRSLRRLNRNNRRIRTRRTGRRNIRERSSTGRKNFRQKRRRFTGTLGRRRQEKKQN